VGGGLASSSMLRQTRSTTGLAASRTAVPGVRRGMSGSSSAARLASTKPSSVPTGSGATRLARGGRVRLKEGVPTQPSRLAAASAGDGAGAGAGASSRKVTEGDARRKPLAPMSVNSPSRGRSADKAVAHKARGTFDSPPRYAPSKLKKENDAAVHALAGERVRKGPNFKDDSSVIGFSDLEAEDAYSKQVTEKARALLADAHKLAGGAGDVDDNGTGDLASFKVKLSTAASARPVLSPSSSPAKTSSSLFNGFTSPIKSALSPSHPASTGGTSSSSKTNGAESCGPTAEGTEAPEDTARALLAQAQLMTQSGMSVQDSIAQLRRVTKEVSVKATDVEGKGLVKTQKQFIGQASRMMTKIQQAEAFSKKYSGVGAKGPIGLDASLGLE
jgi:hypothetical protein